MAQQGVDRAAGRECGGRFFFFAEMFLTTNTLTVIGGEKEFITKFESDILDTFCKSH